MDEKEEVGRKGINRTRGEEIRGGKGTRKKKREGKGLTEGKEEISVQ